MAQESRLLTVQPRHRWIVTNDGSDADKLQYQIAGDCMGASGSIEVTNRVITDTNSIKIGQLFQPKHCVSSIENKPATNNRNDPAREFCIRRYETIVSSDSSLVAELDAKGGQHLRN
jgi:hypothetical protein